MPRIVEIKEIDGLLWVRADIGNLESGSAWWSPKEQEANYNEGYRDAAVELGKLIHWPDCWDTAAYPSLADALRELGCNPEDCIFKGKE